MPETTEESIKPFQGPPATPENFTEAYPEFERAVLSSKVAPQASRNPLDAISERNLAELRRQVRANPFPAGTVINLHPWPLQASEDKFLRGIVIPACNPGQDFAYHHIRAWMHDKEYSQDGTHFTFKPIKPIDKAAQFLVRFANPEMYGGGVIIYEGDRQPNKIDMVELYTQDGLPMVTRQDGYETDDEDHRIPVTIDVPVKGKLQDLIEKAREDRNEFYLRRVTQADEWFKSQDSKDRRKITPMHRLMAEVLVAEGILKEAPDWNLTSKLDKSKGEAKECKSCGSMIQGDPYRCTGCGNILKALEAFMDGAIEWGHAKLELLPEDQFAIAEAEHKRRAEAKKARKRQPNE
jgi:hypothetical protein